VPVVIENTPNPRAMKFTLDVPVGGPATFTDSESADDRVAPVLLISGVQSLFMTGNFVTVTRTEEGTWETIVPEVVTVLESGFG